MHTRQEFYYQGTSSVLDYFEAGSRFVAQADLDLSIPVCASRVLGSRVWGAPPSMVRNFSGNAVSHLVNSVPQKACSGLLTKALTIPCPFGFRQVFLEVTELDSSQFQGPRRWAVTATSVPSMLRALRYTPRATDKKKKPSG